MLFQHLYLLIVYLHDGNRMAHNNAIRKAKHQQRNRRHYSRFIIKYLAKLQIVPNTLHCQPKNHQCPPIATDWDCAFFRALSVFWLFCCYQDVWYFLHTFLFVPSTWSPIRSRSMSTRCASNPEHRSVSHCHSLSSHLLSVPFQRNTYWK